MSEYYNLFFGQGITWRRLEAKERPGRHEAALATAAQSSSEKAPAAQAAMVNPRPPSAGLPENFDEWLNGMYGLSHEEAVKVDPYLAKIGFDGKDNRFLL